MARAYLYIFQPEGLVDIICCKHPALRVPHELLCLLHSTRRCVVFESDAGTVFAFESDLPVPHLYNLSEAILNVRRQSLCCIITDYAYFETLSDCVDSRGLDEAHACRSLHNRQDCTAGCSRTSHTLD